MVTLPDDPRTFQTDRDNAKAKLETCREHMSGMHKTTPTIIHVHLHHTAMPVCTQHAISSPIQHMHGCTTNSLHLTKRHISATIRHCWPLHYIIHQPFNTELYRITHTPRMTSSKVLINKEICLFCVLYLGVKRITFVMQDVLSSPTPPTRRDLPRLA